MIMRNASQVMIAIVAGLLRGLIIVALSLPFGTFDVRAQEMGASRWNGGTVLGDVNFASGRPSCDPRAYGALGDGSTDDDAAFVACLATLTALSPTAGGVIYNSSGHFCLQNGAFSAALAASSTSIALNGPGRLISNTLGASWLDTCGADVDLIHLNASGSSVRGLRITGAPFTTNPAHNALTITNSSIVEDSLIEGGYHAVATGSGVADWTLDDNNIRNAYGSAVIEAGAAGGYLRRNKVDGAGTAATAPTAWTASATVTAGQSVTTLGPNGVSYIIHYTVSGTSGGTAPVVAKYGNTFSDGTASAILAMPVGAYALEVNATLVIAEQDDFSGNYSYGVHVTGASANFVSVSDDMTANLNGSILVDNGYATILNGLLGGCLASPCKVVNVTTSAIGATIGSGTSIAGAATGIEYDAGTILQVTGARFSGLTNGINVGTANLSNISIVGNVFGYNSSPVTNGVIFANGTSDHVEVWGNTFANTTTPFTGTITGTHNAIEQKGALTVAALTLAGLGANDIVGQLASGGPLVALPIPACTGALTWAAGVGYGCNVGTGTGTVTEHKSTASGGAVASGNCDNINSNASSPCNVAAPGGFLNFLRNSSMSAWFHGTSIPITTAGGTCAEGVYLVPTGGTVTCAQTATTVPGSLFNITITGNTSVTDVKVRFVVESYTHARFFGKNVTFQMDMFNQTGGTVTPTLATKFAASGQDNWATSTPDLAATNMQACTNGSVCVEAYTLAVTGSSANGYEFVVDLGNNFSTSGKSVTIGWFDARVDANASTGLNSNPPPYEVRDVASDIVWNQRFYQTDYDNGVAPGATDRHGMAGTAGVIVASAGVAANSFRTAMRCDPAINVWDGAGNPNKGSTFTGPATWTDNFVTIVIPPNTAGHNGFPAYAASSESVGFHYAADCTITGG